MNDKISHFVFTRYNLSLFSDKSMHGKINCTPEEWMINRFKLFSNFTFPSIKAQTCQNFTWFIFLDPKTPKEYRDQLEQLTMPNMKYIYLKGGQLKFIKNKVENANNIVITGRIDNDDAWHEDFVKTIQEKHSKPTRLIEMAKSYWLDVNTGKLFLHPWKWYYRLNPTVGNNPVMVEWRDKAKTIQIVNHTKLIKHVKWYQFKVETSKTYRLIVCHGGNLVNNIKNKSTFVESDISRLEKFNVQKGLDWIKNQSQTL